MTIILLNPAEAGSAPGVGSGAAVTAGNSGGSGGNAYDTVTATGGSPLYSTAQAMHGTFSYLFSTGAASTLSLNWTTALGGSFAALGGRAYIFPTSFTVGNMIARGRDGSANQIFRVVTDTAGHIVLRVGTGNTLVGTGANAMSTSTWYRLEWFINVGASATVTLNAYLGDSTTLFDQVTSASANTGVANIAEMNFGVFTSTASVPTTYLDGLAVSTGSMPGPEGVWNPAGLSRRNLILLASPARHTRLQPSPPAPAVAQTWIPGFLDPAGPRPRGLTGRRRSSWSTPSPATAPVVVAVIPQFIDPAGPRPRRTAQRRGLFFTVPPQRPGFVPPFMDPAGPRPRRSQPRRGTFFPTPTGRPGIVPGLLQPDRPRRTGAARRSRFDPPWSASTVAAPTIVPRVATRRRPAPPVRRGRFAPLAAAQGIAVVLAGGLFSSTTATAGVATSTATAGTDSTAAAAGTTSATGTAGLASSTSTAGMVSSP